MAKDTFDRLRGVLAERDSSPYMQDRDKYLEITSKYDNALYNSDAYKQYEQAKANEQGDGNFFQNLIGSAIKSFGSNMMMDGLMNSNFDGVDNFYESSLAPHTDGVAQPKDPNQKPWAMSGVEGHAQFNNLQGLGQYNAGKALKEYGDSLTADTGLRQQYQNMGMVERLTGDNDYFTDPRGFRASVSSMIGFMLPAITEVAIGRKLTGVTNVASRQALKEMEQSMGRKLTQEEAKNIVKNAGGATVSGLDEGIGGLVDTALTAPSKLTGGKIGKGIANNQGLKEAVGSMVGLGNAMAWDEAKQEPVENLDKWRKQGLSDEEIIGRAGGMIAEEYPAILLGDALTAGLMGGKLARAFKGSDKFGKRALINAGGLGADMLAEGATEAWQTNRQNKYLGSNRGLWDLITNPTPEESGAFAEGALGSLGLGGFGAVRGTAFGDNSGVVSTNLIGQTMDNGTKGCVEAVRKIGAEHGISWLADAGTDYVPALVQKAEADGILIPFDESQLQAGDVIVYGDNDHVVMYDGQGGYVGNSSSKNQIVQSDDYTDIGMTPTKIIKTGQGGFTNAQGGLMDELDWQSEEEALMDNAIADRNVDDATKAREYLEMLMLEDKTDPETSVRITNSFDNEEEMLGLAKELGFNTTESEETSVEEAPEPTKQRVTNPHDVAVVNSVINSNEKGVRFKTLNAADEFAKKSPLAKLMDRKGLLFTAKPEFMSSDVVKDIMSNNNIQAVEPTTTATEAPTTPQPMTESVSGTEDNTAIDEAINQSANNEPSTNLNQWRDIRNNAAENVRQRTSNNAQQIAQQQANNLYSNAPLTAQEQATANSVLNSANGVFSDNIKNELFNALRNGDNASVRRVINGVPNNIPSQADVNQQAMAEKQKAMDNARLNVNRAMRENYDAFMETLDENEQEFMNFLDEVFYETGKGFRDILDTARNELVLLQQGLSDATNQEDVAWVNERIGGLQNAIEGLESIAGKAYEFEQRRNELSRQGENGRGQSNRDIQQKEISNEILEVAKAYGVKLKGRLLDNNVPINEKAVDKSLNSKNQREVDHVVERMENIAEKNNVDIEDIKQEAEQIEEKNTPKTTLSEQESREGVASEPQRETPSDKNKPALKRKSEGQKSEQDKSAQNEDEFADEIQKMNEGKLNTFEKANLQAAIDKGLTKAERDHFDELAKKTGDSPIYNYEVFEDEGSELATWVDGETVGKITKWSTKFLNPIKRSYEKGEISLEEALQKINEEVDFLLNGMEKYFPNITDKQKIIDEIKKEADRFVNSLKKKAQKKSEKKSEEKPQDKSAQKETAKKETKKQEQTKEETVEVDKTKGMEKVRNEFMSDEMKDVVNAFLPTIRMKLANFFLSKKPHKDAKHDSIYGGRTIEEVREKMEKFVKSVLNYINLLSDFTAEEKQVMKEVAESRAEKAINKAIDKIKSGATKLMAVTNSQITPQTKIPVVDVTGQKKINPNNKEEQTRIATALKGTKIKLQGLNGIGTVKSLKDGRHLVHSSNNQKRWSAPRQRLMNKIDEVLSSAIYVEKHPDYKSGKGNWVDLFVPIYNNGDISCFRVVAKELKDTGTYEIDYVGFYDIIKVGTVPTQAEQKSALKFGTIPTEISLSDLLKGVKDRNGKPFINKNGEFNYAEGVVPPNSKLMTTEELLKNSELTQEEQLDIVKTEFPSGTNFKQSKDSISFKLNGKKVIVNYVDHIAVTEEEKAIYRRDYGKDYEGEVIGGIIRTGANGEQIISLLKKGDKSSISHEAFHMAFRLALTKEQQKMLLDKYGTEEECAEVYRKLLKDDVTRGTMFDMTTKVGRAFQKIWNMAQSLFNALTGTSTLHDAESILHAIADNSIYDLTSDQKGAKSQQGFLQMKPILAFLAAFHGSGVNFDEFSADFIGTGEGATAHGYGLYFALDPKVAIGYADSFADGYKLKPNGEVKLKNLFRYLGRTLEDTTDAKERASINNKRAMIGRLLKGQNRHQVISSAIEADVSQNDINWFVNLLNEVEEPNNSYVYKVDIPSTNDMLHESSPYATQPSKVKEALNKLWNDYKANNTYTYKQNGDKYEVYKGDKLLDTYEDEDLAKQAVEEDTNSTKVKELSDFANAKEIYKFIRQNIHAFNEESNSFNSDKEASLWLNKYGIEGIFYNGGRDGNCCVVFNDKAIKILERNGEPVNTKATSEEQMEAVRKQYEGTDQWMKTPNGKPTNLTEKQWLQVRTPNFKEWFGDWENDPENASKVVDENGEPLVVYHGKDGEINKDTFFVGGMKGAKGTGAWFTSNPEIAKTYGKNVQGVFLNIRQPYEADLKGSYPNEITKAVVRNMKTNEVVREEFDNGDETAFEELEKFVAEELNDPENDTYEVATEIYDTNSFVRSAKKNENIDGVILENLTDVSSDVENVDYDNLPFGNDYVIFDANQVKSATENNGEFSKDNNSIKLMAFAGKKAKNAPLDRLAKAEQMEKDNVTPEEIYKETGLLKGKDNKWRFEIPDNLDNIDLSKLEEGKPIKLGDLYDNEALFEAYPELRDIEVIAEDMQQDYYGLYTDDDKVMSLDKGFVESEPNEVKKTILHEMQHAIQFIENFAKGANDKFAMVEVNIELDKVLKGLFGDKGNALEYIRKLNQLKKALVNPEKNLAKIKRLTHNKPLEEVKELVGRFDNLHEGIRKVAKLSNRKQNEAMYDMSAGEQEAREVEARAEAKLNGEELSMPEPHKADAVVVFGDAEIPISAKRNEKSVDKNDKSDDNEKNERLKKATANLHADMEKTINNSHVPAVLSFIRQRHGDAVADFIEREAHNKDVLLKLLDDVRELVNNSVNNNYYDDTELNNLVKRLVTEAIYYEGEVAPWQKRLLNQHKAHIIFVEEAFSYGYDKLQGNTAYGGGSISPRNENGIRRPEHRQANGNRHQNGDLRNANGQGNRVHGNEISSKLHHDIISTHRNTINRWIKEIKQEAENNINQNNGNHPNEQGGFSNGNKNSRTVPNPNSAESLKKNGDTETRLDKMPKVDYTKLNKTEKDIMKFGKALGVPVHFVTHYDPNYRGVFTHNGEIFINRKATVPAKDIFVHEFVHWLKASGNEAIYDSLSACLENINGVSHAKRLSEYRKSIFNGENMTNDEIIEEIICDAISHTNTFNKMINAMNGINPTMAERTLGYVKSVWDKFCNAVGYKQNKPVGQQELPNYLNANELAKVNAVLNKQLANLKDADGKAVFVFKDGKWTTAKSGKELSAEFETNPVSDTMTEQADSQVEAVRKQYEGTDKWMKAPNGKPTNLTEQQWLQVRTPNFKKWFGDWEAAPETASKVVDENGEPLVVYHGTGKDFDTFDVNKVGDNFGEIVDYDRNFYFTASKNMAHGYGKNVIPVFLNIRNPQIFKLEEPLSTHDETDEELEDSMHDALISAHDFGQDVVEITGTPLKDSDGTIYQGEVYDKKSEDDFYDSYRKKDKAFEKTRNNYQNQIEEARTETKKTYDVLQEDCIEALKERDRSKFQELFGKEKAEDMLDITAETTFYNLMRDYNGDIVKVSNKVGGNKKIAESYKKASEKQESIEKEFKEVQDEYYKDAPKFEDIKVDRYNKANIYLCDNPNQIKSATENNGDFSTDNDNIKYSRSKPTEETASSDTEGMFKRATTDLLKKMGFKVDADKNVDVVRKSESPNDINVLNRVFNSPSFIGRYNKLLAPFVSMAKSAVEKQEKLRYDFRKSLNEVEKILGYKTFKNDSNYKENKDNLNKIMILGDTEGKEYNAAELQKMGYNEQVIKAYLKMRKTLNDAWEMLNDINSRMKFGTSNLTEGELADLKKNNPFLEVTSVSSEEDKNGRKRYTYKYPSVTTITEHLSKEDIDNLKKNEDVKIISSTQINNNEYIVKYAQRRRMGKIKGYVPHMFHEWSVVEVDNDGNILQDENGNSKFIRTFNNMNEAVKFANGLDKKGNYRVMPKLHEVMGASERSMIVQDYNYLKIMDKVVEDFTLTSEEAVELMNSDIKTGNRGRFLGNLMKRKGVKGYEQDMMYATYQYLNQVGRYVALDPFKRLAYSLYEKQFGKWGDEKVYDGELGQSAKWAKTYINAINGVPTDVEKNLNNALHSLGVGRDVAGGRPAIWLAHAMTYPMTIAKLGVLNVSSALLNITQLANLFGAMGDMSKDNLLRVANNAVRMYWQAWKNPDSQTGKLLWKDLGLRYQLGMDVAGGYSKSEVDGVASMQGALSKLAGKSMFMFRGTDSFGRGVTLLTAYQKAMDEGKTHAEAVRYAKMINDRVNFDYSVADANGIYNQLGVVANVLLQFKKYPMKQLELFYDIFKEQKALNKDKSYTNARALAALGKYMMPYMALSGIAGVPFIGLASAVLGLASDDDRDLLEKLRAYLRENYGEKYPILVNMASYGLLGGIGINAGSRIGVGDFLGDNGMKQTRTEMLIGSSTTLGSTAMQTIKQLMNGNYVEALRAINPSIGNVTTAYKGEVRTTRGRLKYTYADNYERFVRALGFTPVGETIASEQASDDYFKRQEEQAEKQAAIDEYIAHPTPANAKRLNELGITPKSIQTEVERKTKTKHELSVEKEEKKAQKQAKAKNKKPKVYTTADYNKALNGEKK